MPKRNTEKEFGGNRKEQLYYFCQAKGKHSRLAPQELCPILLRKRERFYILWMNEWSCSVVSDSAAPWTVAYQALSMGFSRQEYWSGLPFPSPRNLPDPGIEPGSPALQADALPSKPPEKSFISFRRSVFFSCKVSEWPQLASDNSATRTGLHKFIGLFS